MVKINIKKGDITEERVDVIVNAANNTLLGGGGVDGAIHSKGGRIILEQCKKLGGCPTGGAKITTAGDLHAKYVIHTVGPRYEKGDADEEKLLYNAYYNSLKLADEYNLKSISFPSISTGAYNYPIEKSVDIVVLAVTKFLESNKVVEEINFVLYSDENYKIYNNKFSEFF